MLCYFYVTISKDCILFPLLGLVISNMVFLELEGIIVVLIEKAQVKNKCAMSIIKVFLFCGVNFSSLCGLFLRSDRLSVQYK